MAKISAVIITYNEEDFIDKCLKSIDGIADEIIVVDSFSTDSTEEVCKKYDVRFVKHAFEGYRDQKNYALTLASHNHVLSLDADEVLSDKLRESILNIKDKWNYDGYLFNRRNNYCGKWIRHSQWYPDRQLRLFYSKKGEFGKLNIHEKFILSNGGKVGKLKGDILHWPVISHADYTEKLDKYSLIAAREFHLVGKKTTIFTPYLHMTWGFIRSYIINGGFLDGRDGYMICSSSAKSVFRKYSKLRQFNKYGVPQ